MWQYWKNAIYMGWYFLSVANQDLQPKKRNVPINWIHTVESVKFDKKSIYNHIKW